MKTITASKITEVVRGLCLKANFDLRNDVRARLHKAYAGEKNTKARANLGAIIDNARIAKREKLAICQDTGMPTVFVELGQDIRITGDLKKAITRGVEIGYSKGSLRNSIVRDPLCRKAPGFGPPVIHIDTIKGSRLKITVLPKGFGCENKSQVKMFNPTAGWAEIRKFILDAVKAAGPDGCPPYVVGVGIGGTVEYACLLAKKALLRKVTSSIKRLERELLQSINKLGIGPMGLGGRTTALAVHIETYPTHIAGLPVAVNISCHALRSAQATVK